MQFNPSQLRRLLLYDENYQQCISQLIGYIEHQNSVIQEQEKRIKTLELSVQNISKLLRRTNNLVLQNAQAQIDEEDKTEVNLQDMICSALDLPTTTSTEKENN